MTDTISITSQYEQVSITYKSHIPTDELVELALRLIIASGHHKDNVEAAVIELAEDYKSKS